MIHGTSRFISRHIQGLFWWCRILLNRDTCQCWTLMCRQCTWHLLARGPFSRSGPLAATELGTCGQGRCIVSWCRGKMAACLVRHLFRGDTWDATGFGATHWTQRHLAATGFGATHWTHWTSATYQTRCSHSCAGGLRLLWRRSFVVPPVSGRQLGLIFLPPVSGRPIGHRAQGSCSLAYSPVA